MTNLLTLSGFVFIECRVHRRTHTCHAKHWPTPTSSNYLSYTLTCTYAMALAVLSHVASGKPHTHAQSQFRCTCLIPVPVQMLDPSLGTHVKSQFQSRCLISVLKHIFNPRSCAHFLSQSWYTCFICIIKCRPAPMAKHLLHSDLPLVPVTACHRQASGTPTMYTYFI